MEPFFLFRWIYVEVTRAVLFSFGIRIRPFQNDAVVDEICNHDMRYIIARCCNAFCRHGVVGSSQYFHIRESD